MPLAVDGKVTVAGRVVVAVLALVAEGSTGVAVVVVQVAIQEMVVLAGMVRLLQVLTEQAVVAAAVLVAYRFPLKVLVAMGAEQRFMVRVQTALVVEVLDLAVGKAPRQTHKSAQT